MMKTSVDLYVTLTALLLSLVQVSLAADAAKEHTQPAMDANLRGSIHDLTLLITLARNQGGGAERIGSAYADRAAVYMTGRDYEHAVNDYDQAIRFGYTEARVYSNRAYAHCKLGNYQAGIDDFTSALSKVPDNPSTLLNRATAYEKLGQLDRAAKDRIRAKQMMHSREPIEYARVAKSSPHYAGIQRLNALALSMAKGAPKSQMFMTRAGVDRLMGHWQEALADMNQAIAMTPDSDYYVIRADIYINLARYQDALADCKKSRAKSYVSCALEGRAHAGLKDYARAVADFSAALEDYPNFEVERKRRKELFPDAHYNEAFELCYPSSPLADVYYRRGIAYQRLGNWQAAIGDFSTVLKYEPKKEEALFARGSASVKLGKLHDAIADYTSILEKSKNDELALKMRGDAYCQLADTGACKYDAAIDDYTRAIALASENVSVHLLARADAYDKMGKHDLAETDRKRAREHDRGH